jgi:hypothetical protein
MLVLYAEITKSNDVFKVLSVFTGDDTITNVITSKSIVVSRSVFDKMDHILKSGKVPTFPTHIDVSKMKCVDVSFEEPNELEVVRTQAYMNVMKRYESALNRVGLFEMYNVMMINNELALRGIFITPENMIEKNVEIVGSGDLELIELFIKYIDGRNRMDPMLAYYEKLKEFKEAVLKCENVEEITELEQDAMGFIQ